MNLHPIRITDYKLPLYFKVFAFGFILSCFTIQVVGQTQNYWVKKSDFTGLKRERAISFSINGKGYVGTGVDTADVTKKDFWEYDPVLDAWTQKADLLGVERRNAIGFSIGNKGYIGTGMDHSEASLGSVLSDLWEYSPLTNVWIPKASFPGVGGVGVYFATVVVADDKAFVCGGKCGPGTYSAEMWSYDPVLDSWTQKLDFPGGVRYKLCGFELDNKPYMGLGVDQDIYRKDVWMYDPSNNTWIAKADFAGGERGAVSTFSLGHRGFICLGNDGGLKKDLWEYNPYSDSWSVRAPFAGSSRKNAIAFTIGDSAFVGTGKGVSGKKMSMYVYTPYAVLAAEEYESTSLFTVYPNPVAQTFYLISNMLGAATLEVFDLNGKHILTQQITNPKTKVNRGDLNSGLYILTVKNHENQLVYTKKIFLK